MGGEPPLRRALEPRRSSTTYRRWQESGREQTRITRIAVRFTFPQELAALLHYNGFTILRQYGDWNLEPLSAASPSIIVVCRRRA